MNIKKNKNLLGKRSITTDSKITENIEKHFFFGVTKNPSSTAIWATIFPRFRLGYISTFLVIIVLVSI